MKVDRCTMPNVFESIRPAVIDRARSLVYGQRIDIAQIARSLGVVEISERAIEIDGYLAKRPDGRLAIRYKANSSPLRVRFTIAHEIGHILIAAELGRAIVSPMTRSQVRDDAEEILANRIASELLMPESQVYPILAGNRVAWSTVYLIANRCEVSVSAAARRIGEVDGLPYLKLRGSKFSAKPDVFVRRFGQLRFNTRPIDILTRLESEAAGPHPRRTHHSITTYICGRDYEVSLLGWNRDETAGGGSEFFGWRPSVPARGNFLARCDLSQTKTDADD